MHRPQELHHVVDRGVSIVSGLRGSNGDTLATRQDTRHLQCWESSHRRKLCVGSFVMFRAQGPPFA